MSRSDPTPVLSQFPLVSIERIEPLDMARGWSGSQIWRLTAAGRLFCLRRWPAGQPTDDRLRLIHHVLTHAAAEGIDFVPVPLSAQGGESFVQHAGHLWELAPWMPGRADYREHPSPERLAAAMTALARFHVATASIASEDLTNRQRERPDRIAPPAIVERLELVERLLSGQCDRLESAVHRGLGADLDSRAMRIISAARHRLLLLRGPLAAAARIAVPLQPAIRDVHHDHILFTGEQVTGLVDFGAMRIDTPLADIARLLGSLAGDDAASRRLALDWYSQIRSLSNSDRGLVHLLDQANAVLSGFNWLQWLYLDRRDMGPLEPILRRLDEILARLT